MVAPTGASSRFSSAAASPLTTSPSFLMKRFPTSLCSILQAKTRQEVGREEGTGRTAVRRVSAPCLKEFDHRNELTRLCRGPDLLEPHILRSLSNVKATAAYASHSGCYFVVLDIDGAAWLFGRNDRSALGVVGELVSENAPIRVTAQELGAGRDTTFVYAACGRNHTLLVGSEGQLWTCGANHLGQVSSFCLPLTTLLTSCVVWAPCLS